MAKLAAPSPTATIHQRPDWVALALTSDAAVLIGRRVALAGHSEVWDLPVAPIEVGERPSDTALRLASEQLALELVRLDVVNLGTLDTDTSRLHFLATKRWTGIPRLCRPESFSELGWFAPSAIRRMPLTDPRVADMASLALATLLPDGA